MPKTIYKVPFTFTITSTAVVVAETPEEARDLLSDIVSFDDTNLDESYVFWDPSETNVIRSSAGPDDPVIGEASEVPKDEQADLIAMYELEDAMAEEPEGLDEDEEEDLDEEDESTSEQPGKV